MFLKFNRQGKLPLTIPQYQKRAIDSQGYSFLIRRATVEDIDTLVNIEEAVYAGQAPWLLRDFLSELSRPHIRLYLVIERHNQVIGFAGAAYQREIYDMHITNIAVVPVWQGNGLGRLLIEDIANFSKNIGIHTVSLEARSSNVRAIALYQRLGFKNVGIKKGYYLGDHEDAISMVREIDNKTSQN
ncbi:MULTISPECIES: ribosomal protein S18-alanine N-acetyltransferase [Leuconostoc]|jgi:ribosomal-protein-alanine N-acetyltransferase|nr:MULTISPECIES: ribosomal protein S18-alanine N-acetyltransferase [Leuconostoc]KAF0260768.1 ribosomal-protein-alanine N-acetyltransferase [Leuconostoc citreum]MBA5938017.1 ribosomal protein S18-alanine N-acetyltransferase [Leuconostoc citreum]MBE4725387.1 ribosomal protein S18-alanine N-acetyltransferase [Leuconostoc citreum]MBU7450857.1 ribosomal protein S18-alanine N-acetyltransferase [Leuconostoc citreum]MCJ2167601.1 ribosomal protein S18-alanine N-acetyltransferase [Leuconostoc citreum]